MVSASRTAQENRAQIGLEALQCVLQGSHRVCAMSLLRANSHHPGSDGTSSVYSHGQSARRLHAAYRDNRGLCSCAQVECVRTCYLLIRLQENNGHLPKEWLQRSLCLPRLSSSGFPLLRQVGQLQARGKPHVGKDEHNRKNGDDDSRRERNFTTHAHESLLAYISIDSFSNRTLSSVCIRCIVADIPVVALQPALSWDSFLL